MAGSRKRNLARLSRITALAVKHGFGYYLQKFGLIHDKEHKDRVFELPDEQILAKNFRFFLEECGPTFVKVGQLLSVRPDLMPPEFIFELEKLQDEVPPFPFETAAKIFREEIGLSFEEVFKKIDQKPVASASIGQVYTAWLKGGTKVAVKIRRPTAEQLIKSDMELVFSVLERVKDRFPYIDIMGFAKEFSDSLNRELDYRIEARHIDRFRHNFRDDELIKIPLVFWELTGKRILSMEYVEGTKISDLATPEMAGIDTYELAIHGARAFMKQVLEDGFFHGDLHPSNLMMTPDGKIAYLDFGIVGYVSEEHREAIARLLIGIIRQDAGEIIEQARKIGLEFPPEKIDSMRHELEEIINVYYGRTLGELEIDIIGREFLALVHKNGIVVPKDFAMLAKALITIEGVAKQLYPQINMLEVAKPYVLDLISKKYPKTLLLDELKAEAQVYAQLALELPKQLHEVLKKFRAGSIEINFKNTELEKINSTIRQSALMVCATIIFFAVFILVSPYPGAEAGHLRLIYAALLLSYLLVMVYLYSRNS